VKDKDQDPEAKPGLPRWFAWAFAFYATLSVVVSVTIIATLLIWCSNR
jgi:hypothetical protein